VKNPVVLPVLLGALLAAAPLRGAPVAAPGAPPAPAAATTPAASQAGAPAADAPEVALKRVNLLVRDLDRSLAIYRDILGFRVFQISESSPQSYSYPVFRLPPQAKLRFCTLDSSTETRALALTEVTGVALPAAPAMHLSAPVIRIARFDEVRARLEAAGLAVVEPRRSKTAEGRDFREMAFADPDGHLVVLYQLD
jgi:catechol 2,3-dioxygenase-like lactoylglutathione lyase family enzyme